MAEEADIEARKLRELHELRKGALDRALLLNAATFEQTDAAKIVENARLFEAYVKE